MRLLIFVCFAVQTCTVTEAQFNALNFDKGTCTVEGGKVVLDARGFRNATTCNFACKLGFWHNKGDTNIEFTCEHNGGVTNPVGVDNWNTMTKCQGA